MSDEWQPIETAPKDGTWVLLSGGDCGQESDDPSCVSGQWTTYLNGGQCEGHWQFAWFDGGYYGWYDDPTHWMPLPNPPATGDRMMCEAA